MGNFYYGSDLSKADSKFRIAIPARQRKLLGESFKITRNIDPRKKNLCLFDDKAYSVVIKNIQKLPVKFSQDVNMLFTASTYDVKPDKQGRIVIPATLRDIVGIQPGDSVVIAGVGSNLDIHVQAEWDAVTQAAVNNKEFIDALSMFNFADENE